MIILLKLRSGANPLMRVFNAVACVVKTQAGV